MVKISLVGASGRMGGAIISSLTDDVTLVDAVERPGSDNIGKKVSEIHHFYGGDQSFIETPTQNTDVVIDFAAGEGMTDLATLCADKGWALVSGRTGISTEDEAALRAASQKTAILHAGNMSLGANLLSRLAAIAAKALPDVDIEISEVHHRFKKDAPSGTALMLADSVADAMGWTSDNYIYGREGHTGERPRDQMAIHTIRSGDTVGDHTVSFGLLGERIELSHRAHDRKIFARGALKAAQWISGQKAGFYAMKDVLGI